MATLTETAFYSRKIIKYGSFILIGFLVGRVVLNFSLDLWRKFHPPAPPPPTVSFNKLPPIEFPQKEKVSGLTFKLETAIGTMPQFPDRANVYFMPYLRPNLLAPDRAKNEAALMGFKTKHKIISEKIYQWNKINNGNTVLKMNIFSGSFIYSYDWQNNQAILLGKSLPGKEEAIKEGKSFLQKGQIIEEDILQGRAEVKYLKASGGKLLPAISLSEANFAKIEMFRKNINELPVLTSSPNKGIISILISGANEYEKRIVKVEFNYFPIKYDSLGTYPIKSADEAWQELKNGQGFIADWQGTGVKATIRKIYLAYFDAEKPQKFMQPIIVFEGDNNFIAYIPAIISQWYL